MRIKFSEDVISLSDLKVNPGKVVNRAKDTHRPILLTSRGRGIAVVQGLDEQGAAGSRVKSCNATLRIGLEVSRVGWIEK